MSFLISLHCLIYIYIALYLISVLGYDLYFTINKLDVTSRAYVGTILCYAGSIYYTS